MPKTGLSMMQQQQYVLALHMEEPGHEAGDQYDQMMKQREAEAEEAEEEKAEETEPAVILCASGSMKVINNYSRAAGSL